MRISYRLKPLFTSALAASVAMGIFASAPAANASEVSPSVITVESLTAQVKTAVDKVNRDVQTAVDQANRDVQSAVAQARKDVDAVVSHVQAEVSKQIESVPVSAPAPVSAPSAPKTKAPERDTLTQDDLLEKRTGEDFIPLVQGPNYQWRHDIPSMIAAQHFGPVLHRVPGSYFNQPDIPQESLDAEREGYSLYGPGTPVYIGEEHLCTIAATGVDEQGHKVAITAGHCGKVGDSVTSADSWRVGPSGTVVAVGENLDYSVIELGSNAKVTNSYNGVVIHQLGGKPLKEGEMSCKRGVATGRSCGITWLTDENSQMTQLCAGQGDSGGPVLKQGRLVGIISGGVIPNYNFSCRSPWQGNLFMPTISVSADAVLADIDARGGVGKGLKLVQR